MIREFGVVLAAAVLISSFVSLTITPVLNVYLTSKRSGHGWFYEKTEPFFTGMENGYLRLLKGFIKIRWAAWVLIAVCGVMIWLILGNMQSEIAPMEDRSSVRFSVTLPEGCRYSYTSAVGGHIASYCIFVCPGRGFVLCGYTATSGIDMSTPRIRST